MVARFHYDDAVYRQLLADELTPTAENDVTEHIEGCTDCQTRLEAIAGADIGWEDVRRFLQPEGKTTRSDASPTGDFSSGETFSTGGIDFLSESDDPDSLGRFGRYEIKEILGRGGMGVVMRGYDPALDRHSAIKVLAPELAANASARHRFSREAKSAAAVAHEHVVPIQTVDEERGLPYLVMPVLEGKSLERRVAQTGPLELKEVLRIGMQIASGLAAAHAQGLVHRDVKPANILLENAVERVMITDFGLARAVDDANMTQSGVIAGTPQYMSPEQARGNDVDHRSDLFSLGSVLYFMCAGRSPFRAETTMGVLNRIANDTPRSLRKINPDVPAWLQDIIQRLLEKHPDRRFQSASDVAEVLGEWLAHVQQPDVAPRPASVGKRLASSRGERSWSPARTVAAIIAGGLLFLTAAVVIVLEWNKGTILIECVSPEAAVRIMKGDKVYQRMTVTPTHNSVRIAAGQYVVEIEGEHDGLKVENDAVTVTRGNTHLVRIIHDDVSSRGGGALAETESFSPTSRARDKADSPAKAGLLALQQLRGVWIAANRFGAGPLERTDESASLRLTVADTKFAIELLDSDQHVRAQFHGALSLWTNKKPSRIELSFQRDGPLQTTLFGEYQIEGDRLTITVTAVNNPRDFIGAVPAIWEFVRRTETPGVKGADRTTQGVPLDAAVREFNKERIVLGPDHGQPPLTVDEVVASIRWATMDRKEDFSPEQAAGFEVLLKDHRLPHGWRLTHSTRIGPGVSETFECWSIMLQFPQGSHTIRRRMQRQPDKYDEAAAAKEADADAVPLAAAIREFNEAHRRHSVGKDQPPLTEEEVVAAVRWWKHRRNEAPVTNAEFQAFQQIADTRSLPKEFEFAVIDCFEPGEGYEYAKWSVRIKMQRTAKPGWTYAFVIRERFINSRLIDDGTIAWGKAGKNGLQAGVRFTPFGVEYATGQTMAVRFYFRNTGDDALDVSLPNLITHAYYNKIHVSDASGKTIPLRQDTGPGGPVGWMRLPVGPDTTRWVNGLPISIGDASREQGVETAILAKPRQTCRVSFTLPNFAAQDGEPLQTGELQFLVTEASADDDAREAGLHNRPRSVTNYRQSQQLEEAS